jgi:hypothetical protein
MCLQWQHWTKALVWFDDVDIPAFHSCVVVDLWQSLSEWHQLLSAARMLELELEQRTNIKFLVQLGKSGNEIRDVSASLRG